MQRAVGRYLVLGHLASGGMASVHLGRLRGEAGFRRLVAIKILHAALARDPEVRAMFIQEARIVSGIRHRHVVQTLDVLEDQGDLLLVMEYVDGVPISRLMKDVLGAGGSLPVPIVVALVCDMLEGLHAAHEARGDEGRPLDIVHRDVSPQNVMVARDGSALMVDFGIARAADRGHLTTPGQIKGKAAYMAPEQAKGEAIDRRVDVYAASIIGWELLTGERLFAGDTFTQSVLLQLDKQPPAPSSLRDGVSKELDAALLRGLAKRRDERFATAHEMVLALEASSRRASRAEVSEYLLRVEADFFRERDAMLEQASRASHQGEEGEGSTGARAPVDPAAETVREAAASRAPAPRLAAAVVVALALGAGAVTLAMRGAKPAPATPPPAASFAAVLEQVDAAEPLDNRALAVPDAGAVAVAVAVAVVDAGATSTPQVPGRTPRPPATHGSARPSPSAPAELPACCAGGLRLRFSDCRDNCPSDPPP